MTVVKRAWNTGYGIEVVDCGLNPEADVTVRVIDRTGKIKAQATVNRADLITAARRRRDVATIVETRIEHWKARAEEAEAKLAEAERTLTELAPARDERIIAWEAIAKHEAFRSCYDEGRPLLNAVVDRIGALLDAEGVVGRMHALSRKWRAYPGGGAGIGEAQLIRQFQKALDPRPMPQETGTLVIAQFEIAGKEYEQPMIRKANGTWASLDERQFVAEESVISWRLAQVVEG